MNIQTKAVLAAFALAAGLGCATAHEPKERPVVNQPSPTVAEGELVRIGTSEFMVKLEGEDEPRSFRRTPMTRLLDEQGTETRWNELEEGATVRVSYDTGIHRDTAREVQVVDRDGIREGFEDLPGRVREDLGGAREDLRTYPEEVREQVEEDTGVEKEELDRDVSEMMDRGEEKTEEETDDMAE